MERKNKKENAKVMSLLMVLSAISITFLAFAIREIWKMSPIPVLILLGLFVLYLVLYLFFLTKLGQKIINKLDEVTTVE